MKLVIVTEWIEGHGEDVIVNFDQVTKIESAAYETEVHQQFRAERGDDTLWAELCDKGLDFPISKITFANECTMLLHGSANEINAQLKGGEK